MTTTNELVEAVRLARKTAIELAMMAEPERRAEAFRLLAVSANNIDKLVTDPELRYRIACPVKRGKQSR